MLSRLMTQREQLLLLGVVVAVCLGAIVVYAHDRSAKRPAVEVAAVEAAPTRPEQPSPSPAPVPAPLAAVSPPEPKPTLDTSAQVAVSVRGAVRMPGLYRLNSTDRVQDLIDKARGPREDAELSEINLAAKLIDGSTLTVPARGIAAREGDKLIAKGAASAAKLNRPEYILSMWPASKDSGHIETPVRRDKAEPEPPPASVAQEGPIDLNTAPQEQLDSLLHNPRAATL